MEIWPNGRAVALPLRNEFQTAPRRVSTTKKQTMGDVVECAALSSSAMQAA
jgi:hypothetical protein